MLYLILILYSCACSSVLFNQTFESFALSSSNWQIIPINYKIQLNQTATLSIPTSYQFQYLKSVQINSTRNGYYLIEFDYYSTPRKLSLSNGSTTNFAEANLPAGIFKLEFNTTGSVTIALVNPFAGNQINVVFDLVNNMVSIQIVNRLLTNDILTFCPTSSALLIPNTSNYYIEYNPLQKNVNIGYNTTLLKSCSLGSNFIQGVMFYQIITNSTITMQILKSDLDYHGFNLAIELVSGGCSINNATNQCIVVIGYDDHQYPEISGSLDAGQSGVLYHVSYLWQNLENATSFALVISDLQFYETNPIGYDTFVDNITIKSVVLNEVSVLSGMNMLANTLNSVSYINEPSSVLMNLNNHRVYRSGSIYDRIYSANTINSTVYDDIIVLDSSNHTVYANNGNDIIVTGGGSDVIFTGIGNDNIVVHPDQIYLYIPDYNSSIDTIDLTTFSITNSSKLSQSVSTSGNTLMSYGALSIQLPSNTLINLTSNPTIADCSKDIAIGYYNGSCLYVCPAGYTGLNCQYTAQLSISRTGANQGEYFTSCTPYVLNSLSAGRNISFMFDGLSSQAHYSISIEIEMFVSNTLAGDTITIQTQISSLPSVILDATQFNNVCNYGMIGKAVLYTQTFSHSEDLLQITISLVSNQSNATLSIKSINLNSLVCYPGCGFCSGPLSSDCATCPLTFNYYNKSCVCSLTSVLNISTCVACSALFSECLLCTLNQCTQCIGSIILNSNNSCLYASTCVQNCYLCNTNTTCSVCQDGFYLSNASYCSPCNSNCIRCTSTLCLQCEPLYFVYTANKSTCQYYCDLSCTTCVGPYNYQCSSCVGPRIYSNSICACPFGTYSDPSYVCQGCLSPCLSCTSATICLTCYLGFIFVPVNSSCVCSSGYYSNSTACLPCPKGCNSCNTSACISCSTGYSLNQLSYNCVQVNNTDSYVPNAADTVSLQFRQVSVAVTAIASMPIILQGNPFVILQIFDITQQISYISYLNLNFPGNFNNYLNGFLVINFNFFPNIITDNTIYMNPPPGFQGQCDSLFFRNISQYIIVLAIILFGYMTVKIFIYCFHSFFESTFVDFVIQKILAMFEWGGFIVIVLGSYTSLCLYSFLQLENAAVREITTTFSYLCAFIFLLFLLALPLIIYKLIEKSEKIKGEQKKQEYDLHFGILYSNYDDQHLYQKCFIITTLVRKIAFTFILVYLQYNPTVQVSMQLFVQVAFLVLVYKFNPYKSRMLYYKDIITQILCIAMYCSFQVYAQEVLLDYQFIFGYLDIVLISSAIVVHLVSIAYQVYLSILELVSDFRAFVQKNKPVQQQNPSDGNLPQHEANMNLEFTTANHQEVNIETKSSIKTRHNSIHDSEIIPPKNSNGIQKITSKIVLSSSMDQQNLGQVTSIYTMHN